LLKRLEQVVATGRIVWGDLFKGTPKLDDNDQPAASAKLLLEVQRRLQHGARRQDRLD